MESKTDIQKDLAGKEKMMKDDISNLMKKQKVSSRSGVPPVLLGLSFSPSLFLLDFSSRWLESRAQLRAEMERD